MAATKIECSQCGSHDYQLLDSSTGEVMCPFCRSHWTVPSLIQKTETEKFLELQSQQPRVVSDNTTETDKQLMSMLSGVFNLGGCLKRITSIVAGIIAIVVLVIVAIILYYVIG